MRQVWQVTTPITETVHVRGTFTACNDYINKVLHRDKTVDVHYKNLSIRCNVPNTPHAVGTRILAATNLFEDSIYLERIS